MNNNKNDQNDGKDGYMAKDIFNGPIEYGYNDITLLPGIVRFDVHEVNLKSQLTTNIYLNTPMVSSPMDTVTESELAIAMALEGGIGIIHCNNTIETQQAEVKKVKTYRNGFVQNPIVFSPLNTIEDIRRANHPFSTFPITESGKFNPPSKLVGVVSTVEYDWPGISSKTLLKDIMITNVITCKISNTLDEAIHVLKKHNLKFLPMVDDNNNLISLVCRKDIMTIHQYPLVSMDNNGRLLVGATITTRDFKPRVDALVQANVDVIVIDSSQGASIYQVETINYIKNQYPNIQIIGGNVVTNRQAKLLIDSGVNGLRVGMSIGSICITSNQLGVGRAQATAVYKVANFCRKYCQENHIPYVPVIADGGIATSGHIAKALALGANTVMMGSMLAGTDESPGEIYQENGVRIKKYRGMGSLDAMQNGRTTERYFSGGANTIKVPQGVSGTVTCKGSVHQHIPEMVQAVKLCMQVIGTINITELHHNLEADNIYKENMLFFAIQSINAQKDAAVHDLYSYK